MKKKEEQQVTPSIFQHIGLCITNCYYSFNLHGILENMTSFTPILNQDLEQGKLLAVLNSRKYCKGL